MQPPTWMLILLALIVEIPLSGCAAALMETGPESLRRQAEAGDSRAGKILKSLRHYASFLRGIALWRMISLGLAGAAGWSLCSALFPAGAEGLEAVVLGKRALGMLLLLLVFYVLAWLIPRRLALHDPMELLRRLCPILLPLVTLVRPITGPLAWVVRHLMRLLFKVDPDVEGEAVSEQNIRMMMDIGEEHGSIDSTEKEMIENVFDFNDLTAEDVMIHRTDMTTLWVEDPEEEILKTIREAGLSRYPVYDEDPDDIIGILYTRDFFLNTREEHPRPVKDLLRKAYFIPETVPAGDLFRDMQTRKIHMAIVVDEYGGTSGLVTMEDLLEEIVGKIYDEFDPQDEQDIIRLGDDQWRVAGSAELEDLGETVGVDFPDEEESDTLGGLVFSRLSVIPEAGDCPVVEAYGLRIQVESLEERRIAWALVTKLPTGQPDEPEKEA